MRGPMSSPAHPSGISTPSSSRRSVSASNERPRTRSTGSTRSHGESSARARIRPASSAPSSSTRESPVAIPWAEKKLKHMAPPDQQLVGDLEEPLDDANLVGDLGAAERHAQGVNGIVADSGQRPDLALEQQARVGRKQLRHPHGGGMGSMGRAEGVVHVHDRRARPASGPAPGRCPSRPARSGCSRASARRRAPAVAAMRSTSGPTTAGASTHLAAEQPTEPRRDRGHRERRVDSLRSPQVRDEHQRRAALAQPLDGRQRAANPRVVLPPRRRPAGR